MHGVGLRVALAGLVLVTVAACEPIYVLPGGALSSPEHPAPVNWAFTADEAVVQLETRPADPYSVNLWGVGLGPYYYVSSAPGAKWAALVAEEPRVRLRSTGASFRCPHLPSPMPRNSTR